MLDIEEMKIYLSGLNEICDVLDSALGMTGHSAYSTAVEGDLLSFLNELAAADAAPDDDEKAYIDAFVKNSRRGRQLYENRDETFGNGRDVRNIFEKAVVKQATRLADFNSPTNAQIITLEISDVE